MFVDEISFIAQSGNGGKGCVSFRREKFIPKGGPDGGKGGKGGDVILIAKKNLASLTALKGIRIFKAKNGQPGQGRQRSGKDAEDRIIEVPIGTVCKDEDTDDIICDLKNEGDSFIIAKGGRGGLGNTFFKTSVKQAPKYAQPGEEGELLNIKLELKLIADVGLVGFPNAGKSTLLANVSRASPKIAAYPFTTLYPNLGVVHVDYLRQFIMADIPGLIEGASDGAGLGIRFLKHIERTGILVFVIDISDDNRLTAYSTLLKELEEFNPIMLKKPRCIAVNKCDTIDEEELNKRIVEIKDNIGEEINIYPISGVSGFGLKDIKEKLYNAIKGDKKILI